MDAEIIINILNATPGVLIAAAVTYYFSQRRYTFEKLYDRKLKYSEDIFEKIVLLEDSLRKYVSTLGSMTDKETLEDRKRALKPIQEGFFELSKFFRKKEILFSQKTIDSVQGFIDLSIKILGDLEVSILSNVGNDESAYKHWYEAYQTMNMELKKAKKALKNDLRKAIKSSK